VANTDGLTAAVGTWNITQK